MEPETTNQNQMPPQAPQIEPEKKGGMGPLIGSIIVIIILVIGAIYFWGDKLNKNDVIEEPPAALSESDEVQSLEADLNSTNDVEVDVTEI